MTATQFYAAVDTLSVLEEKQLSLMQELQDISAEIVSITEDFENLIIEATREIGEGDKKYIVDLRLFAGLGKENSEETENIVKRFTGQI